jgi:signal transduction histidine kinase
VKPKLIAIYVIIVSAPLIAVVALGFTLARNEQRMVAIRFHDLLLGRLADIRSSINGLIQERERDVTAAGTLSTTSRDELRRLSRSSGTIRQYFVLGLDGQLIYPSPASELTISETQFLERTRSIWTNGEIPRASGESALFQAVSLRPAQSSSAVADKGWHSGYWGSGLELIYWWRDEQGNIVGAEFSTARLTADIIGILPVSWPGMPRENSALPEARIELVDAKGTTLYGWGGYSTSEGEEPLAELALSPPLASWSLRYFAPNAVQSTVGSGTLFNVLSGAIVIAIALVGLSIYFYRENTRAIREAMQRVTFVNQVSHELKTPLTNIRMYAEMLQDELGDAEPGNRSRLDVIVSESQRLSRLIGNVLTFGRSDKGLLTLHLTPGSIDDAVRALLAQFEPALHLRGICVESDLGADQTVLFDQDALDLILGNLISNAEKYAASGKMIRVNTRQAGDTVTIRVADEGPGIPRAYHEKIFEPYFRISDKLTDGVAGAGFGLTIARELAVLHGGGVLLEPSKTGTCFKVELHTTQPIQGSAS